MNTAVLPRTERTNAGLLAQPRGTTLSPKHRGGETEVEGARASRKEEGPRAGEPGREWKPREGSGAGLGADMGEENKKATEEMGCGSRANLSRGRDLEPRLSAPTNKNTGSPHKFEF